MSCKLCKENRDLRSSHIIPEFLFTPLYDEKHRFHELHLDEGNRYKQKGFREPLLCDPCEQLLSRYERYASQFMSGAIPLRLVRVSGNIIWFDGVDYSQFKLFALSILWRAGVSEMEIFADVSLGIHQERLRGMILAGDPGREGNYPFLISPIIHQGDVMEALVVPPRQTRLGSQLAYIFVFGGLAWIFVVSSHRAPEEIVNASINKAGRIPLIPWRLSEMGFIVNMARQLKENGQL